MSIKLSAHRCGTDKYPELTLHAARHSLSLGADCVEMDIRFTKDQVPVISHDKDGTKLFGSEQNVCDLNLEEFLKLRFLDNPEYHPHTLEEVLLSGVAPILFHIKEGGEQLDVILAYIRKYHYEDKVIMGVQAPEDVLRVKQFEPSMEVLAFSQKEGLEEEFMAAGADIIRLWEEWVEEDKVQKIHENGREVWVMAGCPVKRTVGFTKWDQIKKWKSMNVDGIIINEIEKAKSVLQEKHYYTSLESMKKRYRNQRKSCAFQAENLLEYGQWKKSTRTKLRRLTGLHKLKVCDLKPRLLESVEVKDEGYFREKWLIQTEEQVFMPFYLLKPKKNDEGKNPVIIAAHGHKSGGKAATAGLTEIPEVKKITEDQNYTYGTEFVKRGFYVFCPDARGFGERREEKQQGEDPQDYMGGSCRELSHMAVGLGLTVTGLWVWDLERLVDYIETRDDCDPMRIGCAGLSGGGLQALWLAAMDDRIAFAGVSGYFYGYQDSLLEMNRNCSCNYVPGLWETVDMGEIGALIAPRPLVIESGIHDHLNGHRGIDNVVEQVAVTRKAYGLFHAEDALVHDIFDGVHEWHGTAIYSMAEKYLK